jgi:hypothetical protein
MVKSFVLILVSLLALGDPQRIIGGGIIKSVTAGGGGATPLSTYVIADWEQQEAANTNATDATGNGHTGTQQGNVNTAAGPAGAHASRDYDQNFSEYFVVADHNNLSMGDINFCLESWVYLNANSGFRGFVTKYGAAGNVEYGLIYNGGSERFNFRVSNDGTNLGTVANTVKPNTAQWYHLVGCHDADNNDLELYVDGTAMTPVSHTTGVVASGTYNVELGAMTTNFFFHGRQAYSRIFKNYHLSPTQVTCLRDGGDGVTFAELQAGTCA